MRIAEQVTLLSRCVGVALLTCALLTPVDAQIEVQTRSITLEIIIKFLDDSDAGSLVARSVEENAPDVSDLAEIVDQLYTSTGVEFTPERVTSGRELIVGILEQPLLEEVRAVVLERSEVSEAELVTTRTDNPRLAQSQLLVSFRQLTDEAELLETAYAEDAYRERVQALATELCAPSGVPVYGIAQSRTTLAVIVDRFALLEKLVTQLRNLDYVEYAQPNATVQFMK
jgi:hypothetical protein